MLLSQSAAKDELLEAFDLGADDYIVKPFDGYELRAKLIVARRMMELQERLLAMQDNLRMMATHDSLTGLWNRGAVMDALARELNRAERENRWVCILLADIDHFKQINDRYGHLCGDAALRQVAAILQNSVRQYDTVGRYGGEEFLIVTPGCPLDSVANYAERLRNEIERLSCHTPEGVIPVTISIGAAATLHSVAPNRLLKAADDALYAAKNAGRNRVVCAGALLPSF
jgi:diguanylate cyclase (GGDEF)-like protein